MDVLHSLQMDLHKQINNSFANFKKKGVAKMTRITAEARLAGLEEFYARYSSNHCKILSIKDAPQDHEYFSSNLSDQIVDSYFDRKAEFLQFIDDAKALELERNPPSPRTQGEHNITVNASSIETHSLPKMNLPKFSGKFSEWENFRDLFRSVVHRRGDLDASIKYYHLRTNLTGEAMEHIKSIPIAGDQYERAWNTLIQYYDNKRRTVNTLVASILNIKPMKTESQAELKRISRELYSPLESLKKLGRSDAEIGNDLLVHIAVELFENSTKKEWKKSIDKSNDSPPTFLQLQDFIKGQIENLDDGRESLSNACNSSAKNKTAKAKQPKEDGESSNVHSLQTTSKGSQPKASNCTLCNAEHTLAKCEQFTRKTIPERREFAKEKRICFNCLSSGHPKTRCRSRYNCFTCKARHHTLLHEDNPTAEQNVVVQSTTQQTSQSASCANVIVKDLTRSATHTTQATSENGVLLATALIRVKGPKNKQLTVKALIDPCSQVSLITENLCNQLSLKQSHTRVCVQGIGDKGSLFANKMAHFHLTPHFDSSYCLETTALVLPKLTSYKPPVSRASESLNHIKGLQLADPRFLDHIRIEVLLGADVYTDIIEENIVRGPAHQPIAMSSKLGWLLAGRFSGINPNSLSQAINSTVLHCVTPEDTDDRLYDLLQEFWRAEELPAAKNSYTEAEQACENLFVNTTYRDKEGRYFIRLPWKDAEYANTVKIGNSYPRALRALKHLEARFQKDNRLEQEYKKFMDEYLKLGHMTIVIDQEPSSSSDNFFLPHHAVWKETSSTTKLRTVFNGSSKFNSNESLNDLLLSGPNLLKHPVDPVCSIRNYKIALSADVEKMFRQIGVDPRDRKFQAIIWRLNPQQKILMCILNTLTYGLTCSSYLAIRTLLQMASDYENEHPVAADVVRKEMYSDNVLTGAHSTTEATEKVLDLIELFKKAQMNLRKWCSNETQVLSSLPANMREVDNITLFKQNSSVPILGIAWHTSGDYFCFHLEQMDQNSPISKRNILSHIARIFDPLGWIAPVTIVTKILMQSLWLLKLGWDDPLPKELSDKWLRWVEDLPSVSDVRIPRWTGYTPQSKVELHGFADASKLAYGAVLYLRILRDSEVLTSLQLAKSKVAPIKTLSIPRLELCACVILARLTKRFLDNTKLEISDVHLWTDSADVLFWLRDHPSRWSVFIANRCSEIHTSLPDAFWHHVKSKDNPADVVSRGLEPSKLQANDLWWNGPSFLIKEAKMWPKNHDELNFGVAHVVNVNSCKIVRRLSNSKDDDVTYVLCTTENYHSLLKLLRITSYCLRFIARVSGKLMIKGVQKYQVISLPFIRGIVEQPDLTVDPNELENSRLFCFYLTQRASFKDEYMLIANGKRLNNKNPLAALNPILRDHLIMVGGRLVNALTNTRAKHPIVLPSNNALTTLLIREAHLTALHGGTQLTLATLRQQVWILRGRAEVKKEIRACVKCVRYAARVPTQLMGDLPPARVRPASPFEKAGVDYAGPVSVRLTKTRGKGTLKGFICVFVCMATRAVHLELAEDYSSESFIAAFHRFTARRGHCKHLYSDQGTNFVGADSLLTEMLNKEELESPISNQLASAGTKWHFNPPGAPHFGGLWEAAVKSLKHHVRRVIGCQVLTFSELATLLCRVEACLNSRPLIGITDDPTDLDFLTPAHFLIQRASYLVPEPDLTDLNVPVGKRWQLISQLLQHFWARWKNEYLTALQRRNKWMHPRATPRVGDVVLLRSENTPPGRWPLARITELHPGEDGLVRVVTIVTATGSFRRPIAKLVFLPIDST